MTYLDFRLSYIFLICYILIRTYICAGGRKMNHPFSKETESVIKELQTDIKAGLTKTEADKRLAK